ncbi:hypothetical protein QBC35DRAFT_31584 [Podospora australis]|uniref:Uncharacterized protein n=1 Tax=Podospora australis TaxID=1536484 RepID=A0AAN6WNF4_9PEZI|nr:hypothetical protein QBC35DRAFT_31584 [Podospora australis]
MALRYNAVGQADDDTPHQDQEDRSTFSPESFASRLSANTSESTRTSMVSPIESPSPAGYVNLNQQTFTPLSMNDSDYLSDHSGMDIVRSKSSFAAMEQDSLLSTSNTSRDNFLRVGEGIVRSNSVNSMSSVGSVTAAGRSGHTLVGTRVQSFEALHAAVVLKEQELLAKKSHGSLRAAALASPPATLSPSPSLSPALGSGGDAQPELESELGTAPDLAPHGNPSNTHGADTNLGEGAGLGATAGAKATGAITGDKSSIAAQRADNTTTNAVPQTAASTDSSPSAPISQNFEARSIPGTPGTPAPLSSASVTANTPIFRPTPTSSIPSPDSTNPPLVRTSSTASISLSHPTPDVTKRSQSGAFLGNIAALEATAERLSMTSSIEAAIREEHNELKRTESQRSSILQRARGASGGSDTGSVRQLSIASRKNSILETTNAARFGGYLPGAYNMNSHPHTSSSASARLRSGSKASSTGIPPSFADIAESVGFSPSAENGEDYPFMARGGPGKASTRSAASKMSLAEIAELENPTALTKDAMDAADRVDEDDDEEQRILASAHQQIDPEFAEELERMGTPQPVLDYAYTHEPGMRLQLHQPDQYAQYWGQNTVSDAHRPMTSASVTTYDQAQFRDFDGVHCDPEAEQFVPHLEPELSRSQLEHQGQEMHQPHNQQQQQQQPPPPHQQPRASAMFNTRPTSYFDPSTGQNMMFYPAPVPAMLNLPPKLSKKPKPNARRSQVMSAMPLATRDSRVWLPDPLETSRGSQHTLPLMTDLLGPDLGNQTIDLNAPPQAPALTPAHARQASEASTIQPTRPHAEEQREIRRPQRLRDADNRKSRATMLDGLPPQLRASAFFELPSSNLPKVEVKDGSAMATLDSLLDASAAAPVSAFTDHAFAGKLGSEVYGTEKKKKKKSKNGIELEPEEDGVVTKPKRNVLVKRNSSSNLLDHPAEPKRRASTFSLLPGRRNRDADDDEPARDGVRRSSESSRDGGDLRFPNPLAPGADEESSSEEDSESDVERDVYQGPPTTLLAELQLRKQQNKMRTRQVTQFTNGMHSTLLELDAVAQVEQRARKGKRVNLAWEDPNLVASQLEDDDEDVPLGMLAVAKAAGHGNANRSTMDISALMSEVNRPLGLMERRELEDNEPLSRRRERLQGRDSLHVPMSLDMMQKRMSHMNLAPAASPGLAHLRSQSKLTLPLQTAGSSRAGSMLGRDAHADDSEPEHEGESLAARKARLAAETLPRARPVSGMFSSELLSQFGGDDDAKSKEAHSRVASQDVGKENAPPNGGVPEEEETLGQRRRRLQAEREAREREMGSFGGGGPVQRIATPLGLNPNPSVSGLQAAPLSRPISMADTLGAYPMDSAIGNMNPMEQQRMRREAEAVRVQMEQQAKMAAFSSQMPTSLSTISHGARTGGYSNGRFNNGMGGNQIGAGMSLGYNGSNISLLQTGQAAQHPMGVHQLQAGAGAPGYNPYGMHQAPNPAGGVDMVERWRQGVLP